MKGRITLVLFTCIWEIGIFFLASYLSSDVTVKYQLAARYSARTSFVIIAAILFWMGLKGLKQIYSREDVRERFILFLSIFALNHLIHFIYIVLNFEANGLNLVAVRNGFGALGYILLSLAPFYLWNKKELSKRLYIQIYIFLLIVISIFFVTYLGRLFKQVNQSSPLILYEVCLIFIGLVFFLNLHRVWLERRGLR